MSFNETTEHRRCTMCGRRHYSRRKARAEAPAPLLEWGERQPRRLPPPQLPALRPTLQRHLSMAREARRLGDLAAAAIHETDALLAARMEARAYA
jgi:hypothetical protein